MKLLSETDFRSLIDPDFLIAAADDSYKALSLGKADIPLRTEFVRKDPEHIVFLMPCFIEKDVFGLKVIANRADASRPTGWITASFVMVFDVITNTPLGLVASDHLTDTRSAAGIAAATKVLARADTHTLAVYGAGKLALPSIELVCRVRSFERLIIVSRTRSKVEALKEKVSAMPHLGLEAIEIDHSADAAAEESDVIVTVTTSTTPVFDGSRVRPGTHVNIGGAFLPTSREIDDAVIQRAALYVDSLDSCLQRSGDIVIPLGSDAIDREAIRGEIGGVLAGTVPGRQSDDEITVFKTLGNAVQDIVLAKRVFERAKEEGRGSVFELL